MAARMCDKPCEARENVKKHVLDNPGMYPLLEARMNDLEDVRAHVLDNAGEYPVLAARM